MAGNDWIKVRTKLPKDGRLKIASRKCHASTVTALGALVTLWSFADAHAEFDGTLLGYTAADVDELVGVEGFAEALPIDWIDLTGEWVKLPEYDEHNGTSAKTRAQATKRKAKERAVTPVAKESRTERDKNATREEKRREETATATHSSRADAGDGGLHVIDGDGKPAALLDDAQAMGVGVPAAKRLRAIGGQPGAGIRVTALDPTLLALCAEKFSIEEMALMAAEQLLRKAHLWNDAEVHPELPELLASGATQQQMLLTDTQYADIRAAFESVGIGYIAKALRGRRQDAIDNQSPNRAPAKKGARKHPANENFEGKKYVGTPVDQLSPELRAAVEREFGAEAAG